MGNLIGKKKEKVDFVPEKWQQGLGQVCLSCRSRFVSEECISLCKCYLFAHEECFIKEYAPSFRSNQQPVCIRCNWTVEIQVKYTTSYQCNRSPTVIVSTFCAILAVIAMVVLTATGVYRSIMPDAVGYTLGGLAAIILGTLMFFSNRRKYIELCNIKVRSTQMNLSHSSHQIKLSEEQPDYKSCETLSSTDSGKMSKLNPL